MSPSERHEYEHAGTPDRMVKAPLSGQPARFDLPAFLRSRSARLTMIVIGILLAYALPILRPPLITTTGSDFGGVHGRGRLPTRWSRSASTS